ncbi:hypothetical protein CKAH01_18718 [Colletotrichum kahawae]|uniref:Uncharacterized protein n=1 Tax=Colletotrichum kahawae TaxID=34407 RepID=A0AAE0D132_COLKA|nr:hypothetical protein CKAH01_18718 [Colletotrichum kahawae]
MAVKRHCSPMLPRVLVERRRHPRSKQKQLLVTIRLRKEAEDCIYVCTQPHSRFSRSPEPPERLIVTLRYPRPKIRPKIVPIPPSRRRVVLESDSESDLESDWDGNLESDLSDLETLQPSDSDADDKKALFYSPTPSPAESPNPQPQKPSRSLEAVLNTWTPVMLSITKHIIIYSGGGVYNIQLYAIIDAPPTLSYPPSKSGWKTEHELSWLALDAVQNYWAQFSGGRDGAIDTASPGLSRHCRKVLAVLGHRKKRYFRLELKVIFQGVKPEPVWTDDLVVGMELDWRILNDYWKAAGVAVPPRTENFHDVAEETTLIIDMPPAWMMRAMETGG